MKVSTPICTSELHLLVTAEAEEALGGAWHSHTQSEINSAEVVLAADDSWDDSRGTTVGGWTMNAPQEVLNDERREVQRGWARKRTPRVEIADSLRLLCVLALAAKEAQN
ncbi:hypothetical protein ACLKA6_005562 [Drosophila palustris]